MTNAYSVAQHFQGPFDDQALCEWAAGLRAQLQAPQVTLGLVFMAPAWFEHAAETLEVLRMHARIPLLVGCSGAGLISGGEEIETNPGLSVGLYHLPGAKLKACHLTQANVEACGSTHYWPDHTGVSPGGTHAWLVFADPYRMDCEGWLRTWSESYASLPVTGGLASGTHAQQATQLYLDGEVFEEGVVAVSVGGDVTVEGLLSQGCTPIGDTWTITRAERNFIMQIANRPAYAVLADTFNKLTPQEQQKARGNLLVGLVTNEYQDEFHRGDFLIRNLLGADPASGMLAVGAFPRTGQTMQFQRRDAQSSTEDLKVVLDQARARLAGRPIYGGCLCSCNGRGKTLFSESNHDARLVQEHVGPIGLTGFFCNGEIGPVGSRSFLHGYSAALGLFVQKTAETNAAKVQAP